MVLLTLLGVLGYGVFVEQGILGDIGVLEVYGPIYLGKDIFTSIAVIIFNLL